MKFPGRSVYAEDGGSSDVTRNHGNRNPQKTPYRPLLMGNFTIDDAFEMSVEDTGPRFGALHFGGDGETPQNRHKYKNLENDEDPEQVKEVAGGPPPLSSRSSQCSFSTISNSTQLSTHECFGWTRHPLVQKNKKVVLSSFLLLLLGLVLVLVGVGLQVSPSPAISSAIFFVPGLLLLIPGVYHVIFIFCAVRGRHGFQFFYLPYFDK